MALGDDFAQAIAAKDADALLALLQPELDFRADLTLDRAARIEQVLREVAHPGAASPVTDETEDEEEPA